MTENAAVPEVRLAAAVADLPAYVPGARPAPGARMVKLSSNENPYPPLPSVLAEVVAAASELNRYPDMAATELVEAIGAHHGVPPEWVVPGTGSVAVLQHLLIAACDPGSEVVHAWRSFEAYPIAVRLAGGVSVPVPLAAGGRHDLAAMAAAVTERARAVLVCTPNNPTGAVVRAAELQELLAAVPPHVLVVVDEAYVEFVRDDDAVDGLAALAEHPNVVVLRTFSKAYGLAGLRVGYALARPRIAQAVRAVATPFGVSGLAQRAAVASLGVRDELLTRVETIVEERDRMLAGLRDAGLDVTDSHGNFVWLALGDQTADFATEALAAGVAVRPFVGEGVRVSVGEPEGTDLLVDLVRRRLDR